MDWLLRPPEPVSPEIQRILYAHLAASPKALVAGTINSVLVSVFGYMATRDLPFLWIAILQLPALMLRIRSMEAVQQAYAARRELPVRAFALWGMAWCLLQGALAFTAIRSGSAPMAIVATALILAVMGSAGARNFAAPRYAMALILIADSGLLAACALSGDLIIFSLVAMAPPYLRGQHQMIRATNRVLVAALKAEVDNRERARRDPLTGLANRDGYLALGAELENSDPERLAVFCLDLDGFKPVNDQRGHPAGDELLRQVGLRLASAVGPRDVVARIGGDEFVVVQVADRESAIQLANRLVEVVMGTPYKVDDGPSVRIGVSIGLALAGDDGQTLEALRARADAALYQAKRQGKGRWARFSPGEPPPVRPVLQPDDRPDIWFV